MFERCGCWNITHDRKCDREPTKRCTKCGEVLCNACAKNHHVHETFEKLDATS